MKKNYSVDRVFIVEDDPVYTRLVKYVFELNPAHEVHVFNSGKECLANLHLRPAIVSLDYTLPDISGEKVLERVYSLSKTEKGYYHIVITSGERRFSKSYNL